MSKEEVAVADAEIVKSSPVLIRLDDTPSEPINKSPSYKRSIELTPLSRKKLRGRRICNNITYQSPLIHLGKTHNNKDASSSNLDDSVVVLEELKSSPASGKNKLGACADDSVIILSDNEGTSKTESSRMQKNLEPVAEDDNSERGSIIVGTQRIRRSIRKRSISSIQLRPLKNSPRKAMRRNRLIKPRSAKSKLVSKSNTIQPVFIDSDDENATPNDGPSELNSQMEIMVIDNPPTTLTPEGSLPAAISKPAVDQNVNNNGTSSRSTEPSKQQLKKASKGKIIAVVREDRTGNRSSLLGLNSRNTLTRKQRRKMNRLKNVNFTAFIKNKSLMSQITENQNVSNDQSELNRIGSYYTEETLVKKPGDLRDIIIDGCNVAMAHTNGKFFSEVGLKLVIDYFKLRGHNVKVFVPQHNRNCNHTMLEKWYREGVVVFTPSRHIRGKRITSYDDRYILDYATMCEGIVVSMDQYRDLYQEKLGWQNTIENRLLVPTFVGSCVMFPEDPLGRTGPTLDEFLRH